MRRLTSFSVLASVLVSLAACGGGGNGTSATLASFSSWDAVNPGGRVTLGGVSQSGTFTSNLAMEQITSTTLDAAASGASVVATFDANRQLTAFTLVPGGGGTPLSFNDATDTFSYLTYSPSINVAISADQSKYLLAADPFAFGWDYQSFGLWTTVSATGEGTYGAISAGAMTPGSAIPVSGSALYQGLAGGRYVDESGQAFYTASAVTASANFANRNIAFSTTGTLVSQDLINSSSNSGLDLTGTLSYAPATNQIIGAIQNSANLTAPSMSGSVNARFYGPAAQEIGGTFSASPGGGSTARYAGAFGARQ